VADSNLWLAFGKRCEVRKCDWRLIERTETKQEFGLQPRIRQGGLGIVLCELDK